MPDGFEIRLNGKPRVVPPRVTVAALVAELVSDPNPVAVERNGTIVSKSAYADTFLAAGDRIEIVRFVQGGAGVARGLSRRFRGGW